MDEESKYTKRQLSKAVKKLAKMVNDKNKNEKTKRHSDMENMFRPVPKKLSVRQVSHLSGRKASPLIKKIKEMGDLDRKEKVDQVIDFFTFPTIKYDKEADRYVQELIGANAGLLDYYHKRMNGYFGFEHPLPKKKGEHTVPMPKENQKIIRQQKKDITGKKTKEEKVEKKQEAKQEKPTSVFDATATKTWILDWECVTFKEGYFTVWSPSSSNIHFKPLNVQAKESTGALNYLRQYLKKKLPPIFCTIVGKHNRLTINDPVRLNEAIQAFAKEARQHAAKVKRNTSTPQPSRMSFKQAMSKARQMTASDFRKYKSKFIDLLVDLQDEHYKVIPCVERLAHSNSDTMEFAFMFSIKDRSGKVLIVHENVNPDRSTLLFTILEKDYMKCVRSLYDFLQSAEINKRSTLRNADFELDELGVCWYGSINHDEFNSWVWKIRFYKNNK